jgi:hypothetical protein
LSPGPVVLEGVLPLSGSESTFGFVAGFAIVPPS